MTHFGVAVATQSGGFSLILFAAHTECTVCRRSVVLILLVFLLSIFIQWHHAISGSFTAVKLKPTTYLAKNVWLKNQEKKTFLTINTHELLECNYIWSSENSFWRNFVIKNDKTSTSPHPFPIPNSNNEWRTFGSPSHMSSNEKCSIFDLTQFRARSMLFNSSLYFNALNRIELGKKRERKLMPNPNFT